MLLQSKLQKQLYTTNKLCFVLKQSTSITVVNTVKKKKIPTFLASWNNFNWLHGKILTVYCILNPESTFIVQQSSSYRPLYWNFEFIDELLKFNYKVNYIEKLKQYFEFIDGLFKFNYKNELHWRVNKTIMSMQG